jgi:hypothetical protein
MVAYSFPRVSMSAYTPVAATCFQSPSTITLGGVGGGNGRNHVWLSNVIVHADEGVRRLDKGLPAAVLNDDGCCVYVSRVVDRAGSNRCATLPPWACRLHPLRDDQSLSLGRPAGRRSLGAAAELCHAFSPRRMPLRATLLPERIELP